MSEPSAPRARPDFRERFDAEVASELRAAKARQQVTFPALVAATGIPRNTLLRYLNGHRDVPLSAFAEIARALGLDAGRTLSAIVERADTAT